MNDDAYVIYDCDDELWRNMLYDYLNGSRVSG